MDLALMLDWSPRAARSTRCKTFVGATQAAIGLGDRLAPPSASIVPVGRTLRKTLAMAARVGGHFPTSSVS